MKLAVIGAGFAGTSAAWAAAKAGADVALLHDRAGSSALGSGALDVTEWERACPAEPVTAEIVELALCLGCHVGPEDCIVATPGGVVRRARGREQSVLDLRPLGGKRIALGDVLRPDWDAPSLARAYSASVFAEETGTRFESREVDAIGEPGESRYPPWDFAALHDERARLDRLAKALDQAGRDVDAWLLGPWLGIETHAARVLGEKLGVPVGEALSPLGGAAGARFERARDALLSDLGVTVLRRRVLALERRNDRWVIRSDRDEIDVDRVVVAVGGVAAGGVGMDPARPDHPGGARFHAGIEGPLPIEIDGLVMDGASTLYGIDVSAHGRDVLERMGIATDGVRVRGAEGLFAAGDCVAARPRTALEAMARGLQAARAALRIV